MELSQERLHVVLERLWSVQEQFERLDAFTRMVRDPSQVEAYLDGKVDF